MYFVSPIGTLKSSEMAPQKTVELSSVPTMLVLFFTTEAVGFGDGNLYRCGDFFSGSGSNGDGLRACFRKNSREAEFLVVNDS